MLKFPMTLKIENQKQLDQLSMALQMAFDMNDDIALDEMPYHTEQLRTMALQPDDKLKESLRAMRQLTSKNIDTIIALRDLQHNLQMVVAEKNRTFE